MKEQRTQRNLSFFATLRVLHFFIRYCNRYQYDKRNIYALFQAKMAEKPYEYCASTLHVRIIWPATAFWRDPYDNIL
jgi:hypothetical protein